MTSKSFKKIIRSIWVSVKPFLIFLFIVSVLLSLALTIITLVWLYDEKNITFLVLAIVDAFVLGIFALGFIIVGVKYVLTTLIKKEAIKCVQCGKVMPNKNKFCSSCGEEN